MRVATLHRHIVEDVKVMFDAVRDILPTAMPTKYETQLMNLKRFIERLNVATEPLSVYNEYEPDKTIDGDYINISGWWLGKEELPENGSNADIRIVWHTHPDVKLLPFTQASWSRRRFYFWQLFMHEVVHRWQEVYRSQNDTEPQTFKPRTSDRALKKEQDYYGNYDEIEAHSHNAAMEFAVWYPNLSYRECVHEALEYSGRIVTPTYNFYVASFADSPKHPAMTTFRRKVKSWYDVMKKQPEIYDLLDLPKLVCP